MSDVQTLLACCQELGATLTPGVGGKLKVKAPAPLPADLQEKLKERKPEILRILEATSWLRAKLASPQHIGVLIREWAGQRDGDTGRWVDDLMAARWALSAQAFEGDDGLMWWRLPHPTVQ